MDKCSSHRRQLSRTGKCSPIAEKVSPKEHLINLGTRMLEADGDQEYETAERAFLAAAKAMGRDALTHADVAELLHQARSEAARRRAAEAKARGIRLGRPPKADPAEINRLLERGLPPEHVAIALGLSERTVRRKRTKTEILSKTPRVAKRRTAPSPRMAGGCW